MRCGVGGEIATIFSAAQQDGCCCATRPYSCLAAKYLFSPNVDGHIAVVFRGTQSNCHHSECMIFVDKSE